MKKFVKWIPTIVFVVLMMIFLNCLNYSHASEYTRHKDSILIVESMDGETKGTGIYIGNNLVLIPNHLVKFNSKTNIGFGITTSVLVENSAFVVKSGIDNEWVYASVVLKTDNIKDVALLKLEAPIKEATPAVFDLTIPEVGENIYAIGHPKSIYHLFSKGYVMNESWVDGNRVTIIINLPTENGGSGSAVWYKDKVIGMLVTKLPYVSISFVIPSATICAYKEIRCITQSKENEVVSKLAENLPELYQAITEIR